MKRILIAALAVASLHAGAQNSDDIFRYSYRDVFGSARTMGLSGAWGAAGADLSAASNNPAGLALYRRNEAMGSLGLTANLASISYLGNVTTDSRTGLTIPNLGVVFAGSQQYNGKGSYQGGPAGWSFAVGYNRLSDYQSNIQYSGNARNTSIGDRIAKLANGKDTTADAMWNEDLNNELWAQAWRVRLIDNYNGGTNYASIMRVLGDTVYSMHQQDQYQNRGRMGEWYMGGGVNFEDVVYLGASLVLQTASFTSDRIYSENRVSGTVNPNPYERVVIKQSLRTSGSGVGGKFGIIVRPSDFLRVGLSYHTPVRINLTDYYQNSMDMQYNGGIYKQEGREDYFKYQVITPSRLQASASIIAGKFLIVNADYEMVDYSSGRLSSKELGADFSAANQDNRDIYVKVNNYRVGAEIPLGYTRVRLGYALLGNPFNSTLVRPENGQRQIISGGFGWVYDNAYFFDFSVSDMIGRDYITPYAGNPTSAVNSFDKLYFQLGAGYRF